MALSDARFPPSIVRFHCGVQVAFWGQLDRRSDFDSALGFRVFCLIDFRGKRGGFVVRTKLDQSVVHLAYLQ